MMTCPSAAGVAMRAIWCDMKKGGKTREWSVSSDLMTRVKDRFVTIDGLRLRYIEEGEGPAVVLLHGASLGSSADVFIRNLTPLASAGFRAIAFDQPGFGLSDVPADHSAAFRRDSIPKF